MDGMNRVYLLGNLGSDPKVYETKEGKAFCRLNIAVSRNWSFDTEGKSQRRTDWHSVLVWGRHGQNCAQYLKKGAGVLVEGYISTYQVDAPQAAERGDFRRAANGDMIATKVLGDGTNSSSLYKETKVSIHADRVTFLPDGRSKISASPTHEISSDESEIDFSDIGVEPKEINEKPVVFSNGKGASSSVAH